MRDRNGDGASAEAQTCSASASGGSLNRRALYIGLGIGAAAGVFFGWEWLVAIGAASLIIALAPCLIMCALGVCAMRMCTKTDGGAKAEPGDAGTLVTDPAAENAPGADTPKIRT